MQFPDLNSDLFSPVVVLRQAGEKFKTRAVCTVSQLLITRFGRHKVKFCVIIYGVKRLWVQWTQNTVRGAFQPTIFPLKICKQTACRLCFRISNHTGLAVRVLCSKPSRSWVQIPTSVWLDFLKHSLHAVPLQIFNGQDSWPKGTPDSIYGVYQ